MAPMKVVLNNCRVQQNVMQVQITRSANATVPIKLVLNNCLVQKIVIQAQITVVLKCHDTNESRLT